MKNNHWDVDINISLEARRRLINGLLECSGQLLDSHPACDLWLCRVALPPGAEDDFREICKPIRFKPAMQLEQGVPK